MGMSEYQREELKKQIHKRSRILGINICSMLLANDGVRSIRKGITTETREFT